MLQAGNQVLDVLRVVLGVFSVCCLVAKVQPGSHVLLVELGVSPRLREVVVHQTRPFGLVTFGGRDRDRHSMLLAKLADVLLKDTTSKHGGGVLVVFTKEVFRHVEK